jgi:excisionase family DNA binding protein
MSSNRPFTTGQVAEYCHVSQATIINWIKDGKLECYTTPGGHYRILESDLVSFLKTHGMPVDAELQEPTPPRLLVLSQDPQIVNLIETLSDGGRFDIAVTPNDYLAGAEAVRSKPDAAVIDVRASSDPVGLCRWLSRSSKEITLLLIGDGDETAPAAAAGADVRLSPEAAESLRTELNRLL